MTLNPDLIRAQCSENQARVHDVIQRNLDDLTSFASAMVQLI